MGDLEELYNLRRNFLIIGLTGRLGSGCSSVAQLLTKEKFDDCGFPLPLTNNFSNNEDRKYRITYNYLKENWQPFKLIRASEIIISLLLLQDFNDVVKYLEETYKSNKSDIEAIKGRIEKEYLKLSKKVKAKISKTNKFEFKEKSYRFFLEEKEIGDFSSKLKEEFKVLTASNTNSPFQHFGDNIRKTGNPINNKEEDFDLSNSYIVSDLIKQLIQQYRKDNDKKARIVIDSIRNSFEARYFRERYAAFYLFAINTENEFRHKRLGKAYNMDQIKNLDIEYDNDLKTKNTFYNQDIKSCIQMADVYFYNPDDPNSIGDEKTTLKKSIVRYLSLISQPGIVTPTPEERTMQIAYTAKYNSGCISRQVGAVVTDNAFSVKSIGWNNTPEGQTPCLLRNAEDLINNTDNISFSEYEKGNEVKELVSKAIISKAIISKGVSKLQGRNPCFCFKQVQNTIENQKNQVHTRSLHAEENAILQISKYGGEGLKNGNLFTTASPCELCSKKAYQLGIQKIFYIDPYPGIATSQILKSGTHNPELKLFNGAVGKAYHSIFEPFMAYKDELEVILKVDFQLAKLELTKEDPSKRDKMLEKLEKEVKDTKDKIETLRSS